MPPREHTARAQRFNDIGEKGRMTGVSPPQNAPRDSAGNELPAAYFNAASQSQHSTKANGSPVKKVNGVPRRQERPDMYNDLGERGRKTGINAPPVKRDAQGFESAADFFLSPPTKSGHPTPATARSKLGPGAAAASAARRPVKKPSPDKPAAGGSSLRRIAVEDEEEEQHYDDPFAFGFGGGGSDDEYQAPGGAASDDDDMDVDDGTSLTPATYMQASVRGSKSSPRRSTISSKAQGKRRRISSSPEADHEPRAQKNGDDDDDDDDEDEEEEEEVRRIVGSSPQKGGLKSHQSAPRFIPDADDLEQDNFDNMDAGGDQQDDQDSELEQDMRGSARKNKGKGRTSQGESQSPPKKSSARKTKAPLKSATAPRKNTAAIRKRVRHGDDSPDEAGDDGVRRSRRQRLEPLEYWRNERVIYKRRQSGLGVNTVVRIPKDPIESLANRRKGGKRRAGSSRVKSEIPEEEGVDDLTEADGVVLEWNDDEERPGDEEVLRRIAFTAKMIEPKQSYNNKFGYQRIFTELDYLAGGILSIPSGCEKPLKAAKDNSYIFYCIEGSVLVKIYRTTFNIGPGATFFVPRGNNYSITTTSNRDVKLFFTQGRRVEKRSPEWRSEQGSEQGSDKGSENGASDD